MKGRRIAIPVVVAVLALLGALVAMTSLERAASAALVRVQEERLRAAGESAAVLLRSDQLDGATLQKLVAKNDLDGAFLVNRPLRLLADSRGPAGGRVNLLRADPRRIEEAFLGQPVTDSSYSFGDLQVGVGYFPMTDGTPSVQAVLGLEVGEAFAGPRRRLLNAFLFGSVLALISALALGVLAAGWASTERARQEALSQVVRGETMAHMAAIAAHEIRNPLGIIRGTVDLMRARDGRDLARDRSAMDDIIAEVQRLRRLTDDLLELSANRPLVLSAIDLTETIADAARATELAFPRIQVMVSGGPPMTLQADGGRLRQVFLNLLSNAAEAQGTGTVEVVISLGARDAVVRLHDHGPGIPGEQRDRLFQGGTTKHTGTGLGLVLSRRIVERHGGHIRLVEDGRSGATFEVSLPFQSSQV